MEKYEFIALIEYLLDGLSSEEKIKIYEKMVSWIDEMKTEERIPYFSTCS